MIKIFRGDDHTVSLIFEEGGARKDITGWVIFFTVKEKQDDSDDDALISKDVDTHTDAVNGETKIVLTDEDTDDLPIGTHYYDIQYKDDGGLIKTVLSGRFRVMGDITRRIA